MTVLDGYIVASDRPVINVDAALKRDFSREKLIEAERLAKELVDDLANSKSGISFQVKRLFGFEVGDSVSFGLGLFGGKRQITLVVRFSGNVPVYRLTAGVIPDIQNQNNSGGS